MKTKSWVIGLMFFCTLVTASAQISWKIGVNSLRPGFFNIIFNPGILAGFVLYGIGAVILIICLKYGELSVVYPIIATSFIWVNIFSYIIFNETMNMMKWVGIIAIMFGVGFIGRGSKK